MERTRAFIAYSILYACIANTIRGSIDDLYRDGAGQISRDPHTKRHQTRRERLAKASKQTLSHSSANISIIMPKGIVRASNTARQSAHAQIHDCVN